MCSKDGRVGPHMVPKSSRCCRSSRSRSVCWCTSINNLYVLHTRYVFKLALVRHPGWLSARPKPPAGLLATYLVQPVPHYCIGTHDNTYPGIICTRMSLRLWLFFFPDNWESANAEQCVCTESVRKHTARSRCVCLLSFGRHRVRRLSQGVCAT